MTKSILKKSIEVLELDSKIFEILHDNNIFDVNDLWNLSSLKLQELNLSHEDIRKVRVKLQLNGIDLNRKIY